MIDQLPKGLDDGEGRHVTMIVVVYFSAKFDKIHALWSNSTSFQVVKIKTKNT